MALIGYKFARADGTDHRTGTVNYRENIGKEMIHPSPDLYSEEACGEGYHLGKSIRGAGQYAKPEAIFRCSYSRKDVLGEDKDKVRVPKLKVLAEMPPWKGYGPRGKEVEVFIESLWDIQWFENVGKPYNKPKWALEIQQVGSWYRNRSMSSEYRARAAAAVISGYKAQSRVRTIVEAKVMTGAKGWIELEAEVDCYYAALEIAGGIKNGYFSQLMEVYQAGHFPCSWDRGILVVY